MEDRYEEKGGWCVARAIVKETEKKFLLGTASAKIARLYEYKYKTPFSVEGAFFHFLKTTI